MVQNPVLETTSFTWVILSHEMMSHQNCNPTGHQWLTPVFLATQEAEIRRIMVQSQPRQIVCKTLS
jgi:hypothetical protein